MHTNKEGKIVAYAKAMSEIKATQKMLNEIDVTIHNGSEYDGKLWVGHSNYIGTANKVVEQLRIAYPKANVQLFDIGPVIASHCGPGTVAVFYMGKARV